MQFLINSEAPRHQGIKASRIKYLLGILVLFSTLLLSPMVNASTSEAPEISVTINGGNALYGGDNIPSTTSFEVTIISSNELHSANIIIGSTSNPITLATKTPGINYAYYSTTLANGTYNITVNVRDILGLIGSWEMSSVIVDPTSSALFGTPLNYPNPFDPVNGTTIGYNLSKSGDVTISMHDLLGNLVWKRSYNSGSNGGRAPYNEVFWDGKSDSGTYVGNGTYICLIIMDGKVIGKGTFTAIAP